MLDDELPDWTLRMVDASAFLGLVDDGFQPSVGNPAETESGTITLF